MTARVIAFAWLTSCAFALAEERPLVGAIRWDAWYSDKGPVKEVEHSLGQPKYQYRLPWFARVEGADKVHVNGDSDEGDTA